TRHRDSGIGMDGLVSVKIESEESGQGSGGGIWQIYKDIHLRAVGIARKKYRDFLARSHAVEGLWVRGIDMELHVGGASRAAAIHLRREQFKDFGPALFAPGFCIRDFRAVSEC